jgi:hypothetical protein
MSTFNGFFDNFLSSLTNPKGNLGDYQHAARLYIDNNMRLAPKVKYLYHVVFNINPAIISLLNMQNVFDRTEINLLVKGVDLPSFILKTETLNQYNRKKIVQTGVDYQPITLEFHDDNAGITTFLWESYFRYYYTDSNYTNTDFNGSPGLTSPAYQKTGSLNTMYASVDRLKYKYGLDRSGKNQNFFTSIQVFQLHPQNARPTFTSFTLVNPYIERYQHDKLNQENSDFTINTMTVGYEAVFYNRGPVRTGETPAGFGTTHYDKMPSPLTLAGGGTGVLYGQTGVISNINTVVNEFRSGNFLSGIIQAVNTYENLQNTSGRDIISEAFRIAGGPPPSPGALSDISFSRLTSPTAETPANLINFGN